MAGKIFRTPRYYFTDIMLIRRIKSYYMFVFYYTNSKHPNIRFTKEKEIDYKIPFLDVLTLISLSLVLTLKLIDLLTNLVLYSIPNWVSFARLLSLQDQQHLVGFSREHHKTYQCPLKEYFSVHLVQNIFNSYLTFTHHDCNPLASFLDTTSTFYCKKPYIGPFSIITQKNVYLFAKRYCKSIRDDKLNFSSFSG